MKSTIEDIHYTQTAVYKVDHKESYAGWLQYKKIQEEALANDYKQYCGNLTLLGNSLVMGAAKKELLQAITSMLGIEPGTLLESESGLILSTVDSITVNLEVDFDQLTEDGYDY